jgi:tetratricopeptide (TPR) repeat protein
MVHAAPVSPVLPVVPVVAAAPALAKVPKVAAPVLLAVSPVLEVKPPVRAPINTQVLVSVEVNPFEVREAFQSFIQLLQMGQLAQAQIAADKISTAMGSTHVMSLRAQGYLALKKNDLLAAKRQYLQLNQLLPEDRESGLNLALIDWRLGEKESAAKRVSGLLEKFPNDSEIQALNLNVRNP